MVRDSVNLTAVKYHGGRNYKIPLTINRPTQESKPRIFGVSLPRNALSLSSGRAPALGTLGGACRPWAPPSARRPPLLAIPTARRKCTTIGGGTH